MVRDAELVEEAPRRTLSIGPIIAIVCVMLLVSFAIFLFLWNPDVKEISVINPEDVDSDGDGNYDCMRITFVAIKDGLKSLDERVNLRIVHDEETVYTGNIPVRDEKSLIDIRYDSFVVGNGEYTIYASIGSAKAESSYIAAFVAQELNVSLEEYLDPLTDEYLVNLLVTPIFSDTPAGKGFLIQRHDRGYKLTYSIAEPDGSVTEDSFTMDELPGNYTEVIEVPGMMMGDYTATVTLENTLIKADSPYRLVQGDRTIDEFINRPPAITALDVPSKARVNQEFEITCKAFDPDSNGGLTTFTVSWGELDDDGYEDSQEVNVTSNPATIKVKHIYRTTGTYTITVSVADNGPVGDPDKPPFQDELKLDSEMVDIIVRIL